MNSQTIAGATMSDCIAKIEKLENGFTVEVPDKAIEADNAKPSKPWKDPWKEYAFSNKEEVITFLTKVLDKLEPPRDDDLAVNFKRATGEK